MRSKRLFVTAAVLFGLTGAAHAGNLQVAPLKVLFASDTASATLQVRNAGESATSIQAQVRAWSVSEDGRDVYEPTQDFVFFPRIFELEPGAEGVVRLASRGPVDNQGTEFFVVESIAATGRDGEGRETFRAQRGGWYVLAGTSRPFSLDVDPEACRRSATVSLEAKWGGTSHAVDLPVDPAECAPTTASPLPGPPGGQ